MLLSEFIPPATTSTAGKKEEAEKELAPYSVPWLQKMACSGQGFQRVRSTTIKPVADLMIIAMTRHLSTYLQYSGRNSDARSRCCVRSRVYTLCTGSCPCSFPSFFSIAMENTQTVATSRQMTHGPDRWVRPADRTGRSILISISFCD